MACSSLAGTSASSWLLLMAAASFGGSYCGQIAARRPAPTVVAPVPEVRSQVRGIRRAVPGPAPPPCACRCSVGDWWRWALAGFALRVVLDLLWIACGQQDHLIDVNQKLTAWLKTRDVPYTWRETPGGHSFMVWRRFLAEFLPMLFQEK